MSGPTHSGAAAAPYVTIQCPQAGYTTPQSFLARGTLGLGTYGSATLTVIVTVATSPNPTTITVTEQPATGTAWKFWFDSLPAGNATIGAQLTSGGSTVASAGPINFTIASGGTDCTTLT